VGSGCPLPLEVGSGEAQPLARDNFSNFQVKNVGFSACLSEKLLVARNQDWRGVN